MASLGHLRLSLHVAAHEARHPISCQLGAPFREHFLIKVSSIWRRELTLTAMGQETTSLPDLGLELDRNTFVLQLVRELTGVLQDVVGMEDAQGFISVVGLAMGEHLDAAYRNALSIDRLTREQVSMVLVDLKRRIAGDFYVVEEAEDRIVLGNRACPFGAAVQGRPSLCMMTSNVFGHIASQNLGYAAVELEKTIAQGAPECRVVINLRPVSDRGADVREYLER